VIIKCFKATQIAYPRLSGKSVVPVNHYWHRSRRTWCIYVIKLPASALSRFGWRWL